jgi:alcohol dehydrogenase
MKKFFMPTRVYHGLGSLSELNNQFGKDDKVLIVTDKVLVGIGIAKKIMDILEANKINYVVFDDVPVNPHEEAVAKALDLAKKSECNAVVALGGGSPLDVGKMVAFLLTNSGTLEEYQWDNKATEAPMAKLVNIPTTAGTGSEVTATAVIISRNTKKGIKRDDLFAHAAIIDPSLMVSMPPHITSTTGIDAFTHAYEAYVGLGSNPVTDAWAEEAMQLLIEFLPRAFVNGGDIEAREQVALAAVLAGVAMDQAGLGFIHSCSGPVASYYNVPHGLSNAVFLPYALRFNMLAKLDKHVAIAEMFGMDTTGLSKREAAELAIDAVCVFLSDLNIPEGLFDYFEKEEDIPVFAQSACDMFLMRNNPRKPRPEELIPIFEAILKE